MKQKGQRSYFLPGLAIGGLTSLVLIALGVAEAADPGAQAEFVTLGTAGGPIVQGGQAQPANAVVVNGAIYVFDAGDGVLRQLAAAKLPLRNVRAVFISHHHIDHDAGLGPLIADRWVTGSSAALPVIGPPGTVGMVRGLVAAYMPVIETSPTNGPSLEASVAPRDLPALKSPQQVFEDANIRVSAVNVDHFKAAPGLPDYMPGHQPLAYAYRIEAGGRIFVFSGDTGPSAALEQLAQGADILVTEVVDLAAIQRALGHVPGMAPTQIAALVGGMQLNHLTPTEIGKIAAHAKVKQVVLTHQVPGPADDEDAPDGYTAGIAPTYQGLVRVAKDLDRF